MGCYIFAIYKRIYTKVNQSKRNKKFKFQNNPINFLTDVLSENDI